MAHLAPGHKFPTSFNRDSFDKGGVRDTSVAQDSAYFGLLYPIIEKRSVSLHLVAAGSGISANLPWLSHVAPLVDGVRSEIHVNMVVL